MRFPCLVLDHDDTVVNSTAVIHFPSFLAYLAQVRPGLSYTLDDYFRKNFDPGIIPLFKDELGFTDEELDALLQAFAPRLRRYGKGEMLLMAGFSTREVGLILQGGITAEKPLPDGTSVVIARQGPGGIFADVLAGGQNQSPVNVLAAEATTVLYLPAAAVLQPGTALPSLQVRLLQNWLSTVTHKYFALDDRLELLCCKSLRQRIGLWLVGQCQSAGADSFTTPLTRAELAAYLNCDRSALCRELSRMQQDGLITLRRGGFTVHNRRKLTERNGSYE